MDDSHYGVQKVEIRNTIPLEEAKSKYKRITKRNAKKIRETKNFYHFRLQMPSHFVKGSFRAKKINKDIILIVGELKPEFQHLSGGGFGDYFKRAYSAVSGAVSSVGNKIVNALTIHDYSAKTKRNLELYGELPVIALEIRRKPLNIAIELAFQGVSAGQWEELKKKYGFDKFYHLSAVATLQKADSTKQMAFEKLEVISFNDNISYKEGDGTEILPVDVKKPFTILEMFNRTRKTVGDDRFFSYSGVGGNNCQDFIAMCLTSVGLYGEKEKAFTYQDMKALTDELPLKVKAVARGVTQIGAIANKFLGIGGNLEGDTPHTLNSIIGGMRCWKGYEKKGTKIKNGKVVNNCVKIGGNKTDKEQFLEYVKEHKHDLESKHTIEQMFTDFKEKLAFDKQQIKKALKEREKAEKKAEKEREKEDDDTLYPWTFKGKKYLKNIYDEVYLRGYKGGVGKWVGVFDGENIDNTIPEPEYDEPAVPEPETDPALDKKSKIEPEKPSKYLTRQTWLDAKGKKVKFMYNGKKETGTLMMWGHPKLVQRVSGPLGVRGAYDEHINAVVRTSPTSEPLFVPVFEGLKNVAKMKLV